MTSLARPEAAAAAKSSSEQPVLQLTDATLTFGARTLWSRLGLTLQPGEFLTVLGPNGSGKTSLLKVLLGLLPLTAGSASVCGSPVRRGNPRIGYVPQHRGLQGAVPLRARDLVRLGVDGHRWGVPMPSRMRRQRVDQLLHQVGATSYADVPVTRLSGGELQRLWIAAALASDPTLLLCDEPLLSLDLGHQRSVVDLLRSHSRDRGTAVVFVTHEINPVLEATDRVLYLAANGFALGTVGEVMTTETLSNLYRTEVRVMEIGGRLVVLGATDDPHHGPVLGDGGHAGRSYTGDGSSGAAES